MEYLKSAGTIVATKWALVLLMARSVVTHSNFIIVVSYIRILYMY